MAGAAWEEKNAWLVLCKGTLSPKDTAHYLQIILQSRAKCRDQDRGNQEAFTGPEVDLRENLEVQLAEKPIRQSEAGSGSPGRRH